MWGGEGRKVSPDINICEFVPEKRQAMKEFLASIIFFSPSREIENNTKTPILPASVTLHYIQVSCPDSFDLGI